jgi:dual specificity phosphatase 12
MAKYPATPTPSQPATPAGGHRRKIRCKMCRQHLALREHMMDHILDQAPLSRPRTPSNFALPAPLTGLNLSMTTDDDAVDVEDDEPAPRDKLSRRPSVASDIINPLTGLPANRSRRASLASEGGGIARSRSRSLLGLGPDGLSMTRANSMGADEERKDSEDPSPTKPPATRAGRPILDADQLAARLPPQLAALRTGGTAPSPPTTNPPSPGDKPPTRRRASSNLQFTPASPHPNAGGLTGGPPILVNPKCSGYFVEPLTWMEPVLATGDVAGKLVCPNPKCGAKIGSYDWAGVQCGCKEWVTPVSPLRRRGGPADDRGSASRAARSTRCGSYVGTAECIAVESAHDNKVEHVATIPRINKWASPSYA